MTSEKFNSTLNVITIYLKHGKFYKNLKQNVNEAQYLKIRRMNIKQERVSHNVK